MYVIARVRLASPSHQRASAKGNDYTTGFGFADVDADQGLPVGLVAFSNLASVLGRYKKGDTIRITGDFRRNNYTNKAGEDVEGWKIVAEGIAGVKSATVKLQEDNKPDRKKLDAQNRFYDDSLESLPS